MLRILSITLGLLVFVVSTAGCGGGNDGAGSVPPLALSERVFAGGELEGFTAQPGPRAPLTLDAFVEAAKDAFVRITPQGARDELTADGFVGAVIVPLTPPEKDAPVVASTVVQLGSPAQARQAMAWAYADSLSPCPNVCNVVIEPFDVPGIPGAKGIRRSRPEDPAGSGPTEPFESFEIEFTDGPFLYDVITLGAKPGEIQGGDIVAAARALYGRVKGRPPLPAS
jgi:hypothetical protein